MAEMRQVAEDSNMADICFITVVGQNVTSHPWNQTDDIFEEAQPGLLSKVFGDKESGMFVYNRCGSLEGELPLFSQDPSDISHAWKVIKKAYDKCPQCNKPQPTASPPTADDNSPN